MNPLWITVFGIGVAQGLFLTAALLWIRSGNPAATRCLAALAAVFTLLIGGELLEVFLPGPRRLIVTVININTELAIGPLLLLFVRFLFDPDRGLRRSDLAQFTPLLLGMVAWLWTLDAASRGELDASGFQDRVAVYVVFKATFLFSYLFVMTRELNRGIAGSTTLTVGRRVVTLGWLKGWIAALAVVAALIYLTFFAGHLGLTEVDSDEIGSLLLALIIYLLSLMVVLRPWILSVRPRASDRERYSEDCVRLKAFLQDEQAFLDPDLTLRQLADGIGCTENHLSQVINQGLAISFYDLLNQYRIEHFEHLAATSDPDRNVLDLALESGFNSKASFYRAFQRAHGMTPTEYRRGLKQQ